jgi:hypothetical protein
MNHFLSAAMSCALVFGATAGSAGTITQNFDLTATASGMSSFQFDLNNDGFDDFRVEVTEFVEDVVGESKIQPLYGEEFFVTQEARITAIKNPETYGLIAVDSSGFESGLGVSSSLIGSEGDPYARVFEEGETIGYTKEVPLFFSYTALLYTEGFGFPQVATNDGIEAISEGISIGPFANFGATGLIGLSINSGQELDPFFGWLEITRGSITVGTGAVSTTPGAPVGAGISAVPLPPGLALLGGAFGLMGFAARRRKNR